MIVLGDINDHIGFIGQQKIDRNEEMVIDWMNDFSLILINVDERCVGQHTWSRQNQKSTIDCVLMNNEAYKIFQKMKIDEKGGIMDISDHNLITVDLEIATRASNGYRKGIWEEVVYYSRKKDLETLEDKL